VRRSSSTRVGEEGRVAGVVVVVVVEGAGLEVVQPAAAAGGGVVVVVGLEEEAAAEEDHQEEEEEEEEEGRQPLSPTTSSSSTQQWWVRSAPVLPLHPRERDLQQQEQQEMGPSVASSRNGWTLRLPLRCVCGVVSVVVDCSLL